MAEEVGDGLLPFPERVGDRLRSARMSAGYDIADIAERTRIPLRHLEAIERNDFSSLPSFTYALGFVRAYARSLGVDEAEMMRTLRDELGREAPVSMAAPGDDIADPARIPPRWLAAAAGLVLAVIVIGYAIWRSVLMTPDAPAQPPAGTAVVKLAPPPAPAPAEVNGPITLTLRDKVWLRITDADGKAVFEGEKPSGETIVLPADVKGPMLRSMRADQIDIAFGTGPSQPLSPNEEAVRNFPIDAASVRARASAPPAAVPGAADANPASPATGQP
ncbi:MAG: helix-turn-helix domain-containing protein [Chakrabartia sp.]